MTMPAIGDRWLDTDKKQLLVWDGTVWRSKWMVGSEKRVTMAFRFAWWPRPDINGRIHWLSTFWNTTPSLNSSDVTMFG